MTLLASLPLLWSWLKRRRPTVFVSFQHAHEALAVAVSDALNDAGFLVRRVSFAPGADHQRVVGEMQRLQRGADALVCLPGDAQSVVDAEVYAAAVALQPVVFLVRPLGASLPNSADKRYPVMRIDVLQELGWAPLAELLHHVTLDFRSTRALYGQALRHPLLGLTMAPILGVLMLVLLALFGAAVVHGLIVTAGLGGGSTLLLGQAIAVHAGVLALGALPLLAITAYLALVVGHVAVQFRAARRASLQAGEAAFSREDWLGLIPGLEVGQPLYRALLEQAPMAHHERTRRRARA